jgi:ribonuclease Z
VDEHFYLIDCGEATQIQLRKYNCKLFKINNIFISHLHGDHIFGLYGLLSSYMLLERQTPLNIFAHPPFESILNDFLKHFGHQFSFTINHIPIRNRKREVIWEDDKISVTSFPLKHSIPINGFVFREKEKELNIKKEKIDELGIPIAAIHKIKAGEGYATADGGKFANTELTLPPFKQRSYAYCTDTAYYERIAQDVENVDVLYHEATFKNNDLAKAKKTMHSTAQQAATIARNAGVSKLIIGHFSARYKEKQIDMLLDEAKNVFPNTVLANEGDIHKIELKRTKAV